MSKNTGIAVRHSRKCATKADKNAACTCKPSYRGEVYDRRVGRKIRKTFRNVSEAKSWRHDAASALGRGTMSAPSRITVREAGNAWLEGAKAGTVRTRSGAAYKPSSIRGYEAALLQRVYPEFGAVRLSDIRRRDLQGFVDRLLAEGLDASTIRNAVMPLRAIFRRAVDDVPVNPTAKLTLPTPQGRRDRIASPEEAASLIAALPERDQAVWATAMYAGLRRGELMAVLIGDVDLATGVIRVEQAFDPKERVFVDPKSKAGRRTVPIPAVLRKYLSAHKLRLGWSEGLFFGRSPQTPFDDSSLAARAATAWKNAKLEAITLHEARHTYASLMIAAGVNAKALSSYMGHASVTITYDRYGHLMPGNEDEAAALLDRYLEKANVDTRSARAQ